jgi:acetyl-CoA acetyltransferase
MSDVYVMGVDMIKFGRFPDRSVPNIGAEAALMALDDAGLGIQDMQALIAETWGKQMQWWDKGFFKK